MSANQSLATLLRALQTNADAEDVSMLLGSATTLLTLLANPLNVTLLTSQLLSAPSIWARPDGVRTTLRVLGIFINAARRLAQQELVSVGPSQPYPVQRALSKEDWALAVIKGAGESSPRWRHLSPLAGLLIGFEKRDTGMIPVSLRHTLEAAIVMASNLALQDDPARSELSSNSVALVLSHVFEYLSDGKKRELDHCALLPALCHASMFSKEGMHFGYVLSTMDADVIQVNRSRFDWSEKSSTYVQFQRMARGPIMACLGSLSRLAAISIEHAQDVEVLTATLKDLSTFTRTLVIQWHQNKLCEVDATEEADHLTTSSLQQTLPLLWQTLRSMLFCNILILRSLLGRLLSDPSLPSDLAPYMAPQILHILRNLYFISSRAGSGAFSQYQFVFLTVVDILSQYPIEAEAFLKDIQPTHRGVVPEHPMDRLYDLFFLNIAEHFPTVLSPQANKTFLVDAAAPYVGSGIEPNLSEIFEAAHSVMLAVFSAPGNSELLSRHIHTYLDALFKVFPHALSPRQFRMAIKTLVGITAPPAPIAGVDPLLPSAVMELVSSRIEGANSSALKPLAEDGGNDGLSELSEQSSYVLALTDALPLLPIDQLEEWLPLVVGHLKSVRVPVQSRTCTQRFWEVLSNGEMDVDRVALCVSWWATRGGREMVLGKPALEQESAFMSGALGDKSKL